MPRKKIEASVSVPNQLSFPNRCCFAESRSYNITEGDDERVLTVRLEQDVPIAQAADLTERLQDQHEAIRIILNDVNNTTKEVGDKRKRESRIYFSA